MAKADDQQLDNIHNRYYPRIRAEILAGYRKPDESRESARVLKTKTFGIGGIMLEEDRQLVVGTRYIIELVFDESRIELDAEVVYSIPAGPGLFNTGFRFAEMKKKKRELLTGLFIQEYDKFPG